MATAQTPDSRQREITTGALPRHPSPSTSPMVELTVEEVACSNDTPRTVPRGGSQRQAAQGLDVSRSTPQARRAYHSHLAACPEVVALDIPRAQDATCTGGLFLGGIAPVSHSIGLEQTVQARDHDTGALSASEGRQGARGWSCYGLPGVFVMRRFVGAGSTGACGAEPNS